jgi:hypothetical protein
MTARADTVKTTGTIKKVPGYPGKELEYRASAVRSTNNTAHFWLRVFNNNDVDIKIVVCAMLSLKRDKKPDQDYEIRKTFDAPAKWKCVPVPDPPGDPGSPSNAHLGCKRITVPKKQGGVKGQIDAFDKVVEFKDKFTKNQLGLLYFDVLLDCEFDGVTCDQVVGTNNFLTPGGFFNEEERDKYANVWAGGKKYEELTRSPRSGRFSEGLAPSEIASVNTIDWPAGNWVTMRKSPPSLYPAHLVGTVTGAPAGSSIEFTFDTEPGGTYVVPPDPSNPPCGGLDVAVDETFTIGPDLAEHSTMTLTVPPPCEFLGEGSVIRFNADVFAEPGAPYYVVGEFMYGVDLFLVKDTLPATILSSAAEQAGSDLEVSVEATDATTMPMAAVFVYSAGGPEAEVPIGYADPAEVGDSFFFEESIPGLPFGVPILYHIDVLDEFYNVASTPPATVVLSDPNSAELVDATSDLLLAPNPFVPSGEIRYVVPEPGGNARIAIYNPIGQLVRSLADGPHEPGAHFVPWDGTGADGRNVTGGVYFVRLETSSAGITKRIAVLR